MTSEDSENVPRVASAGEALVVAAACIAPAFAGLVVGRAVRRERLVTRA